MNLHRLFHRDEGAVAVEMALVSPFLLLLLFGIYDFGTLFVNSMEVEHATQAGGTFALKTYVGTGTVTLSGIQSAVTASSPLAVTIAKDPNRPTLIWCGTPASDGNSVVTDAGTTPPTPCPAADGTYVSILGTAASQSKLGSWVGFPSTLATKILIRVK